MIRYVQVEKNSTKHFEEGGNILENDRVIYDYNKLKGKIKEVFGTQDKYAEALGISSTALINKLTGKSYFNQPQIEVSIKVLNIDILDIDAYFFAQKVEKNSTKEVV